MATWWNGWKDTAKRLFIPFGAGADRSKSPVWDLGGQFTYSPGDEEERQRKELLLDQANKAGGFADSGEKEFGELGAESAGARAALLRRANGEDSLSAEQLRQGLQQQVAQQRSMAASAQPGSGPMAARTAAIQSGRASSAMSGQAAMAGIAERAAAQKAYADFLQQQRQQALNATLGGRGTAVQGYGSGNVGAPEKSAAEKFGPAIMGGLKAVFSDRRLKRKVDEVSDEDGKAILDGLKAYRYDYKDEKHGKGRQFGPMAQDLERVGLKHAVIDTPRGKMVDGGRLALSATALVAALGKRVSKLEGGK